MTTPKVKAGPEPTLLTRKEVDALYDTLQVIRQALSTIHVEYIVTGGSLLGAIRQQSLLFCDDDIDIAIVGTSAYQHVLEQLQDHLGSDYQYSIRPWEGGDKVRPRYCSNVFVDIFTLQKYETLDDFVKIVGVKKNGQAQPFQYVHGILETIQHALAFQTPTLEDSESFINKNNQVSLETFRSIFPFWHFSTRKAIEMWPKEVYREWELFPLCRELKFGPIVNIQGPRMPVLLLQRAFGWDCFHVYYQSGSHKQHKPKNDTSNDKDNKKATESSTDESLPPLVFSGGVWQGSTKVPLTDDLYVPMQPSLRAKRRPTLHCRETLFVYLKEQVAHEQEWIRQENRGRVPCNGTTVNGIESSRVSRIVYMDGVFDLFHIGHLKAIQQCASLGDRVIIGVTGDDDAADYKRRPLIPQEERVAIVRALSCVNQVVCPCPLVVTEEFMDKYGIDLVVHGFANDSDAERQKEFFEIPMKLGRFQRISYYQGLSTTDILDKIRTMDDDQNQSSAPIESQSLLGNGSIPSTSKPQWFGATIATATDNASSLLIDDNLRTVMEPHIDKARARRKDALLAIRNATGEALYDHLMKEFQSSQLIKERTFGFDVSKYPLRETFLNCVGLSSTTNLAEIHMDDTIHKDRLLYNLTRSFHEFQPAVDVFVREVCAPHFALLAPCDEIYYQSFPCVRILQPGEFSIGPHSDVAYGHCPASINFYIPLTPVQGTSSLYLESKSGQEDWHPFEADYGTVLQFAGALCTHWTTVNTTARTRVTLDLRLIAGTHYRQFQCGGSQPGGKRDVYRETIGYYSCCTRPDNDGPWIRTDDLPVPDARVGFPWTVKNWGPILEASTQS